MTEEEENEETTKKSAQLQKFEEDADKFMPTSTGCGALLQAKRDIGHLMRLTDVQEAMLAKGDAVIVLYDFTQIDTKERALVLLAKETRYLYMTTEFDDDFEVLREGTQRMMAGGVPLEGVLGDSEENVEKEKVE